MIDAALHATHLATEARSLREQLAASEDRALQLQIERDHFAAMLGAARDALEGLYRKVDDVCKELGE